MAGLPAGCSTAAGEGLSTGGGPPIPNIPELADRLEASGRRSRSCTLRPGQSSPLAFGNRQNDRIPMAPLVREGAKRFGTGSAIAHVTAEREGCRWQINLLVTARDVRGAKKPDGVCPRVQLSNLSGPSGSRTGLAMSQFKAHRTETKRDPPPAKWVRRCPRRASHLLRDLETYQVELEGQNRELRDAQSELEESRHRYAELYHFAPVAYLTLDRAGRILEANLTAVRFFSASRRSLLGAPLACLVEPSGRAGLRDHLRRCLETRREVATVLSFLGKGKPRVPSPTQMTSTPLVDGSGELIGCRTTLTDISALRRTQDRLALLAEVSRLLAAAADPRGAFQENPSTHRGQLRGRRAPRPRRRRRDAETPGAGLGPRRAGARRFGDVARRRFSSG